MSTTGFADAPAGADNPLLDYLGIRLVEARAGHASFEIDVQPRHLNRQGSLQGGVAATLLDAACGYAGLGAAPHEPVNGGAVTVMLSISYLARVDAGRLRATGSVTRSGRSVYFSSGELRSESGELIATTTLGARFGYTMMWLIIISCLIKAVVQAVLGRYIISSGETTLIAFSRVPGPRFLVNWVVGCWFAATVAVLFALTGMYIGVSQVMHSLFPSVSVTAWVLTFMVITLALLLGGAYPRVEKIAMFKVGVFTLITCLAAVVLTRMPEYFSWAQIAEGLKFTMPEGEGLAVAIAVFGITGVASGELCIYPYWCIEKGYARNTGPRRQTEEWLRRARALTLRRQGAPVAGWRQGLFGLGLLLFLVAVASPIDRLGEERLFSFHMLQHVLLGDLAALCVVAGLTGPLLRPLLAFRAVERLRLLAHPLVALPLWAVVAVLCGEQVLGWFFGLSRS